MTPFESSGDMQPTSYEHTMLVVSPLSQCPSIEKRDRFLGHIKRIAPVTLENEPNCYGYAWFRSAGDNDVVPAHWLRGFEIYGSVGANQIEHRASDEYKAFRNAVSEEGLLARPSDLRFWHPTGIGFLVKETNASSSISELSDTPAYLITDELDAASEAQSQILGILRTLATSAISDPSVLSFWVLKREFECEEASASDYASIYVFLRCKDKAASDAFYAQVGAVEWKRLDELSVNRRKTSWLDSGIGFLAR